MFSRNFKEAPGIYMPITKLFIAFSSTRTAEGRSVSHEEKGFFRLNSKRIFEAQWPNARGRVHKEVSCYFNIARKTTGTFFCFSGALILTPDASAEDGAANSG